MSAHWSTLHMSILGNKLFSQGLFTYIKQIMPDTKYLIIKKSIFF